MKFRWISLFSIAALLALLVPAASRADVRDNAGIFGKQAVEDANHDMKRMEKNHGKQFVVETFASIPDDKKAGAEQDKAAFFKKWKDARASALGVNGVYVLICMDPKYLEMGVGNYTRKRGDFTDDDLQLLRNQMQADLKTGDYDKALSNAVDTVERDYSTNIHGTPNRNAYANRDTEYSSGPYQPSYPGGMPGSSYSSSPTGFGGLGTLICVGVGLVIIFSLIRSVFRGTSSGGFGSGYGGNNFGNQGYGGNYGYGGGGGGGFGRGFLGGLLGGAIGGYAADQFDHRNDQSNSGFFGGGGQAGQSDNSGGSSFDSGPSDAGQGFGDNSSGGDFNSGGGGDSGGGGSSGGDF